MNGVRHTAVKQVAFADKKVTGLYVVRFVARQNHSARLKSALDSVSVCGGGENREGACGSEPEECGSVDEHGARPDRFHLRVDGVRRGRDDNFPGKKGNMSLGY